MSEGEERSVLHTHHAVPYICHFVWLFKNVLCSSPISPQALEEGLVDPCGSSLLHGLLTRLLVSRRRDRNLLPKQGGFPYNVIETLIKVRLHQLFTATLPEEEEEEEDEEEQKTSKDQRKRKRRADDDEGSHSDEDELEVVDKAQIASELFAGFEGVEPTLPFHQLSLLDRAKVVQLLCEYRARTPEFENRLRDMEPVRWDPVGVDGKGSRYYHASFWGVPSTRIYVQRRASKGVADSFELACAEPPSLKALIQRLRGEGKGGREVASALEEVYTPWHEWAGKKKSQPAVAPTKPVVVCEPTKRSARLASVLDAQADQRAKEAAFLEQVRLADEQRQQERVQALAKSYYEKAMQKN